MAESWEAEAFVPPPVIDARKFADEDMDEIKDSWEDEDEPEPAPAPSKEVKPKKKPKFQQNGAIPKEEWQELTEKEKEEMVRRSDFKMAQELFGTSDEGESFSLDDLETAEHFDKLADRLSEKLEQHKKNENYMAFLERLFRKLAEPLDTKHIRKLSSDLQGLADQHKIDQKEKKAKTAAKKKPQMKGGKAAGGDVMDDFGDLGEGAPDDDFDDFM